MKNYVKTIPLFQIINEIEHCDNVALLQWFYGDSLQDSTKRGVTKNKFQVEFTTVNKVLRGGEEES